MSLHTVVPGFLDPTMFLMFLRKSSLYSYSSGKTITTKHRTKDIIILFLHLQGFLINDIFQDCIWKNAQQFQPISICWRLANVRFCRRPQMISRGWNYTWNSSLCNTRLIFFWSIDSLRCAPPYSFVEYLLRRVAVFCQFTNSKDNNSLLVSASPVLLTRLHACTENKNDESSFC